jgi:hypothetical protein
MWPGTAVLPEDPAEKSGRKQYQEEKLPEGLYHRHHNLMMAFSRFHIPDNLGNPRRGRATSTAHSLCSVQ